MKILVTGATKGIGKVIAETLEGEIFATGRNINTLKVYKNHFAADLTKEEELVKLGDYIEANEIDVLINNAGAYIWSNIEDLKLVDIKNIINTDLAAPYILYHAPQKE